MVIEKVRRLRPAPDALQVEGDVEHERELTSPVGARFDSSVFEVVRNRGGF